MKVLVTGGAGFIGSHLLRLFLKKYPNKQFLNVDKLTYAANTEVLKEFNLFSNYDFSKTDISDRKSVQTVIQSFKPDAIIHLAAESHVDNSISGPEPFVLTNLVGTFNLLEEFKQLWWKTPDFDQKRFHHISTDEVFGSLDETGAFTESTPYAPNSPYSATKAGSDHLVRAYHETYGLNTIITNCSNNFGPNQHDEKLIPTVIRTALKGDPIPVYGEGKNIRDWLFVEEHAEALDLVFNKGQSGSSYNIGSHNEYRNIDLVHLICNILGPNYKKQIKFVKDRPGHDYRYAMNTSKIEKELQWNPSKQFKLQLEKTVCWYKERYQ